MEPNLKTNIENIECDIYENGNNSPVFIYISSHGIPIGGKEITQNLETLAPNLTYTLVEVFIDNWDLNLSPWVAPTAANKGNFTGNGRETLTWLTSKLVPYLNEKYPKQSSIYLIGYSLGGLFALWSLYESAVFDGIACCSGSLWFPLWDEYAKTATVKNKSLVYLSLGGKEETTKNPTMASVGIRTREQLRLLKSTPNVISATLEMNPGGHFSDTANRIAKAICWLIKEKDYVTNR